MSFSIVVLLLPTNLAPFTISSKGTRSRGSANASGVIRVSKEKEVKTLKVVVLFLYRIIK